MKVELSFEGKKNKKEIPGNYSVEKLLKEMKINPQTVLVAVNNEITLESHSLREGDSVDIIKVISGG
jgi:thiamine biosynthesis protein ThiS